MSVRINASECTSCAACADDCPNDAISEGDEAYEVNAELCTDCKGHYETRHCIEVCPITDAIEVIEAAA